MTDETHVLILCVLGAIAWVVQERSDAIIDSVQEILTADTR